MPSRSAREPWLKHWGILVKITFAIIGLFIVSAVLFDGWPFSALADNTVLTPASRDAARHKRAPKPKLDHQKLLKMAQEAITAGSPARGLDILEVSASPRTAAHAVTN